MARGDLVVRKDQEHPNRPDGDDDGGGCSDKCIIYFRKLQSNQSAS